MKRPFAILLLAIVSIAPLAAQQPAADAPPTAGTPADNGSIPSAILQPVERAVNSLNFFVYETGIYDESSGQAGGAGSTSSGAAVDVGGGVTANHNFATGSLALSYSGGYHTRASDIYPSGTNQNLLFLFKKALTRRSTFTVATSGGIYPQGQTTLTSIGTEGPQSTPFSVKNYFLNTTLGYSYQQTRRLSYQFTGAFSLMRYNSALSYGNDDITGTGSVLYRLTRTTTVSGTYEHSDFLYQHNAGTASHDTIYATISHNLPRHWTVGASGGGSFVRDSGSSSVLLGYLLTQDGFVPVYGFERYSNHSTLPYLQGTVTHSVNHTLISISGGESVSPGNGVFLTSKNLGVNGLFSYAFPRSNFSGGGYYSRLTSLSNTTTLKVRTSDLQLSYAYNIFRHLGLILRYDYIGYGSLGSTDGFSENRLSAGLYFSSKNIPLGLF